VGYAIETKWKCAGCTLTVNPLPFVTAIVASNPGDLVRGASGVQAPTRPAFCEHHLQRIVYEKRFSYKNYRKCNGRCQGGSGRKRDVHLRIGA